MYIYIYIYIYNSLYMKSMDIYVCIYSPVLKSFLFKKKTYIHISFNLTIKVSSFLLFDYMLPLVGKGNNNLCMENLKLTGFN